MDQRVGSVDSVDDVALGAAGLTLTLGGAPGYLNYYWLRDNCPTAMDPETGERVFDIAALTEPPVAASARIDAGCLTIEWANEAHVSVYDLALLVDFLSRGAVADVARMPRRLWRADSYDAFARFSCAAILADTSELCRFAGTLLKDGVALVTAMEPTDDSLTALAQTLGDVTPSTSDGHYFDVQLTLNPVNLAFTAHPLEMHTDLPSEQMAPGIQFLHCRANSVEGGNSLFVDGAAVAEDFRLSHPQDFDLLSQHEIPFFRRSKTFDVRAHQRVIELDRDGDVSGVTISQHLADMFDLPQDMLDRYYPAFCRFLQQLRSDRYMTRFRLNAGECIVFDNHRIVHGREGFSADRGRRHLRGCYVDRGAVRSTYRILSRVPAPSPSVRDGTLPGDDSAQNV